MKPLSHAFEIGYGPSGEVLDHSEVLLSDLPGTPGFSRFLPRLRAALDVDRLQQLEQVMALPPLMEEWVQRPAADERFHIGNIKYAIKWERPIELAAVYSIVVDSQIASVSLLACRRDDLEPNSIGMDAAEEMHDLGLFKQALSRFLPGESSVDYGKFHLIKMTRRPLLASMFWPPFAPTGDDVARTIQRQVAYAFFKLNGEVT